LTVCSSNKGEEPDDEAVRCPFCKHTYESKWADGKLRAQAYSAYEKRKERLSPEEIGDWRRRNGLVWDEVDSLVGTRWEEGLEDGEIEPTLAEDSLLYLLMKNPDNLRLLRERFDAWRQTDSAMR
jgi:DNA-binding transcriptional regulator YiaG